MLTTDFTGLWGLAGHCLLPLLLLEARQAKGKEDSRGHLAREMTSGDKEEFQEEAKLHTCDKSIVFNFIFFPHMVSQWSHHPVLPCLLFSLWVEMSPLSYTEEKVPFVGVSLWWSRLWIQYCHCYGVSSIPDPQNSHML